MVRINTKSTVDAMQNPTLAECLREGFTICDDNNKLISDKYDEVVTQVGKADDAIRIAKEAKADVSGAVTLAIKADEKAVNAQTSADDAISMVAEAMDIANKAVLDAKSAQDTADDATTIANNAETLAHTAIGNAKDAKDVALVAEKETAVISDSVSVTVRTTDGNGKVTDTPVPIASSAKAGAMNAQTFRGIEDLKSRVSDLEGRSNIVYVTFDSSNPSNVEITGKFTAKAGRAPLSGDTCIDISKDLTYIYNGVEWEKRPTAAIPLFKSGSAGLVIGATGDKAGTIIAEVDGTASVEGWDTVSAKADKSINKIERVATEAMLSIKATKNDGTTETINLDAVSAEKAGPLTPAQYARLTKTTGDYDISGRYNFQISPYVPNVKPNELTSQRVAPVSQVHEAFVNADKKANEIKASVTALSGTVTSVSDRVTAIGVTNEIGGTSESPTLKTTVNGKSSEVTIPVGGGKLNQTRFTTGDQFLDFNYDVGSYFVGDVINLYSKNNDHLTIESPLGMYFVEENTTQGVLHFAISGIGRLEPQEGGSIPGCLIRTFTMKTNERIWSGYIQTPTGERYLYGPVNRMKFGHVYGVSR